MGYFGRSFDNNRGNFLKRLHILRIQVFLLHFNPLLHIFCFLGNLLLSNIVLSIAFIAIERI